MLSHVSNFNIFLDGNYDTQVQLHVFLQNSEECIVNEITGEESVKKPQTLMEVSL